MIQSSSQVDAIDKPAAYRDGIVAAVMTAVASASLVETSDGGAKVAVMMSGEIVDALMTIQAALAATSPSASTPTALRSKRDPSKKIPSCDPRSKFTPWTRRI
jgi:hypothetical protein